MTWLVFVSFVFHVTLNEVKGLNESFNELLHIRSA
jgi:hypothetical protein